MAIQKVKEYFKQYNIENRIQEFDVSSATVHDAAIALNTQEDKIAKTLAFALKEKTILIVMSGLSRVDNAKFKNIFQEKANMVKAEEVERLVGHAVGGVCPFAVYDNVKIYLDISLKKYATVFPACGSSNSAIELTINQLEKYSNYFCWIDISKV